MAHLVMLNDISNVHFLEQRAQICFFVGGARIRQCERHTAMDNVVVLPLVRRSVDNAHEFRKRKRSHPDLIAASSEP